MKPKSNKRLGKGASQFIKCNPSKRSRLDLKSEEWGKHLRDYQNDKKNNEFLLRNSDNAVAEQLPENFEFVGLNSLPPAEAAFSIEQIRNRIFSFTSLQDLLQFRLVSRAWRQYGTNKTLLKWGKNTIKIGDDLHQLIERDIFRQLNQNNQNRWIVERLLDTHLEAQGRYHYDEIWNIAHCTFKRPFQELLKVMETTGPNPFPCSRFELCFSNQKKLEDQFQNFFTNHGSRIEYLDLRLFYLHSCYDVTDEFDCCSHGLNWILKTLDDLLHKQAPNLIELAIKFNTFWISDQKCCNRYSDIDIDIFGIINAPKKFSSKLRALHLYGSINQLLFDSICKLVPNVNEIQYEDLSYFLEPTNRLHLLKGITLHGFYCYFRENPKTDKKRRILQTMANMKEELKLKEFEFRTGLCNPDRADIWEEITYTLNQLLKKCRGSLEKLIWSPAWFLSGLKIPHMPNVKFIRFACECDDRRDYTNEQEMINFFPDGMRISECFPNLHTVEFSDWFPDKCYVAEGKFSLGCKQQIFPSVRKVLIKIDPHIPVRPQEFQQIFPNAVIIEKKW